MLRSSQEQGVELLLPLLLLVGLAATLSEQRKLARRVGRLEAELRARPAAGARAQVVRETPPGPALTVGNGVREGAAARPPRPSEGSVAPWERLAGGRLLIWVGGAALALGGVFLVRYSIELGLIGPAVRMALAALLGSALVAAGEAARRRLDEPRIAQALVGSGVLVLYATAYGAHLLYGFYGVGAAFALMALVAAAGLALSLRHGWGVAALGLVGGFATPALLGDIGGGVAPLLAYLGFLNAAVLWAARARRWTGLLGAAVLGTALWLFPLAVTSAGADALAVGIFALAYALAATTLLGARQEPQAPLWIAAATRPAALGLAQLALLTAAQSFFLPGWLLFATLAGAVMRLSRADRLPWLPAGAALLGVGLFFLQLEASAFGSESPRAPSPWLIGAGLVLLFGAPAAWRAARGEGRPVWSLTFLVAVLGPPLALRASGATHDDLAPPAWGALLLGLALLPAALAWRMAAPAGAGTPFDRRLPATLVDGRLPALAAATAILAGAGASDLLPPLWTPAGWSLVALAIVIGANRLGDAGIARIGAATAGVAILAGMAWLASLPGGRWPSAGEATAALAVPGALTAVAAFVTREAAVRRWLWLAAAAAGLGWAGILAHQLTGLARVLSFLALGGALMTAGWRWTQRRASSSETISA